MEVTKHLDTQTNNDNSSKPSSETVRHEKKSFADELSNALKGRRHSKTSLTTPVDATENDAYCGEKKSFADELNNALSGRRHSKSRPTSNAEEPEEEMFVESKMHRKGSRVYKNHGWRKRSRTESSHSDSTVSHSSHQSVSELASENKLMEKSETVISFTPEERKKYVDNKYEDIFDLLKSVGIDINNLQ